METQTDSINSVKALNSILQSEASAVETYRPALQKIEDPSNRRALEECQRLHIRHVATLRSRIEHLGGVPASGTGAWGTYAKLAQGTAKWFGDRSAVAALEEGEDHGLKSYRAHLGELDPASRKIVEVELLPEQELTHSQMSTLKQLLH